MCRKRNKWCITPYSLVYPLLQKKGNFKNVAILLRLSVIVLRVQGVDINQWHLWCGLGANYKLEAMGHVFIFQVSNLFTWVQSTRNLPVLRRAFWILAGHFTVKHVVNIKSFCWTFWSPWFTFKPLRRTFFKICRTCPVSQANFAHSAQWVCYTSSTLKKENFGSRCKIHLDSTFNAQTKDILKSMCKKSF